MRAPDSLVQLASRNAKASSISWTIKKQVVQLRQRVAQLNASSLLFSSIARSFARSLARLFAMDDFDSRIELTCEQFCCVALHCVALRCVKKLMWLNYVS